MFTQTNRSLSLFVRETKHALSIRSLRFFRPVVFALLVIALPLSSVSAAVVRTNLTPPEMRQLVQQTIQTLQPSLYKPVKDVMPSALQLSLDTGSLNPTQYAQFYKVFVEEKAPANQPEVAHLLSLPKAEQVAYSLQRLQQMGKLSAQEVQLFNNLRAAPHDKVRAMTVAALESGSYGVLATAILQVAVSLTNIDTSKDLETCDGTSSNLRSQGWLGNVLNWVGGLVVAVLDGAVRGALLGALFGNVGAGAVLGGIAGGIGYVKDTTGNGFKPGPNGEDCTGWPRPR